MAQEWITSFEPQIMCIGISEGRVTPLVTLRRLEALMLLLRGTYPWKGFLGVFSLISTPTKAATSKGSLLPIYGLA